MEALLAETANELAQAVAEETQPEGGTEETAKTAETDEVEAEAEQPKPEEAVQTAVPDTGTAGTGSSKSSDCGRKSQCSPFRKGRGI